MNEELRLDCDSCVVRGSGCGDCVVSVLLGGPPADVVLDDADCTALTVLAESGLVPPLRHVRLAAGSDMPAPSTANRTNRGETAQVRWKHGA